MKNFVHTCILLFVLLLSAKILPAQQKRMDSLLNVYASEKNDSEKVKTLYFLSRTASKESHFIEGIRYGEMGEHLADSLHYTAGSARASVAAGIANQHLGNFGEALRHDLNALSKYQALGSNIGMSDALNSIGNVYYDQKMYDKALQSYTDALKYSRLTGNRVRQTGVLNNIANAYDGKGDYRRALSIYDSVRIVQLELKNEQGLNDCYMSMGQAFLGLRQIDSALVYYGLALPYYEKSDNAERLAYAYGCFGEALARQGKFRESISWLEKGLALKDRINDKITFKELHYTLTYCDSALGDLSSSYSEYALYLDYKDSLQNDDDIKKQTQAELLYEFGKQSAADSVKQEEADNREHLRHQEEIHQQQLYTIGGISGFSLMLLAAIISLTAYRQNRKRNTIIARQKEMVEMKQKEILDSIHYAKRIQRSLLPSEKYISRQLDKLNDR